MPLLVMPTLLGLAALPVTDPVLIFALAMVIFVAAPLLFERARLPGLIGLIVAGAVVGPNALNLLARGPTIELLGTVGLLYLMFLVGLELDLDDFRKYRGRSIVFGSLSFAIPQLVGTGVGLAFGYPLLSALLLGAVFASHTVLAYPIASRLGILRNLAVTTTLGGTILTEILALLVLAVVAGAAAGGIGLTFWVVLAGSLALYVAVSLGVTPIVARWFFHRVRSEGTTDYVFVLALLFTISYFAHAAHVEPIIGALLAGLALNRLIPRHGTLMNRINFVGDALFIPFFLVSVGMLVDVRTLDSPAVWLFSLSVAGAVMASKWIASRVAQRVFRYGSDEGWVMFGLSVPHASGTLAIVLVGFELGLFDLTEVNGIVLTILITCFVGPWVTERYGRRMALREEQRPYEPERAPRRILIPISNPGTEEALLDLAILVRGRDSSEPLYPLMVVRETDERTEAQVAEAERLLSHAVIHVAAADVPVVPLTRVDQNIATGIARGISETRTTDVVVGWDGGRSMSAEIFGSVLDQLLAQTRQSILLAKLGHPLNVTRRLVLVLPPLVHRQPGFHQTVRTLKQVAQQLGATVSGVVLETAPEDLARAIAQAPPLMPVTLERVPRWGGLIPALEERLRPDDLVVVIGARRGTLAWHPRLERLPHQLASLPPESFLIVFPSEADTPRRELTPIERLPRGLRPGRMVFDLPAMELESALRRILESEFAGDRRRLEEVVGMLVHGERQLSTEVRPGVVVPHARVDGLDEPILFMGTSTEGVRLPRGRGSARLIFVLLSPAERPEEHLRALAEIAQLVSREDSVLELLGGAAADGPTDPDQEQVPR